jgi:hypothetical protein
MTTCTHHVNFYPQYLCYELIFDYLVSDAQLPRYQEPSTYRATFD